MLTLFNYIETGISWKNIPSSPIRNKNKTLQRTVNASSCLNLSAFSIGGRSRRNVLRTGGCQRARVAARTFPFRVSLCVLFVLRCGVLQLLSSPTFPPRSFASLSDSSRRPSSGMPILTPIIIIFFPRFN